MDALETNENESIQHILDDAESQVDSEVPADNCIYPPFLEPYEGIGQALPIPLWPFPTFNFDRLS